LPRVDGYDWEEVNDKIPYTLRIVNKIGCLCGICHWTKQCFGCIINISDSPFVLPDNATIAIHWEGVEDQKKYFSEKKNEAII